MEDKRVQGSPKVAREAREAAKATQRIKAESAKATAAKMEASKQARIDAAKASRRHPAPVC